MVANTGYALNANEKEMHNRIQVAFVGEEVGVGLSGVGANLGQALSDFSRSLPHHVDINVTHQVVTASR
jgi:hypothetical protein